MKAHLYVAAVVFLVCRAAAALELASPFTDHLVLQRELPVPIWGTANPGEKVTVEFGGQSSSAVADDHGRWRITLQPLNASTEPRILTAKTEKTGETVSLQDVLVGEVWLASGQSNMVFTLSKSRYAWAGVINEGQEIASANFPQIRMFTGDASKAYTAQLRVAGAWKICSPENAPDFSAIAYYFARDLHQTLKVPVGILALSYGASTAQAWIRREAIQSDPRFRPILERFDEQVKNHLPPTEAELKDWQHAAELAKAEQRRPPPKPGQDPVQDQHNPTVMYNGMIAPVVPFSIRGVIWYQGESITAPRELFPAWNERLISDWRTLWGRELPFFFCQLAALENQSNSPQVRAWQAEALKIPNTGMAVTIDVGDVKDVHPHNKAPVGNRLARIALAKTYQQAVVATGPTPRFVAAENSKLRVTFSDSPSPIKLPTGQTLNCFEVAGADGVFVPATAEIAGASVLVSTASVSTPVAVRYAWSNFPEDPNLYNEAGLPGAPFWLSIGK